MGLFSSPDNKVIDLSSKMAGFSQTAFSPKNFPLLENFIEKYSAKPEKCRLLWEIYLLCAICYDTGLAVEENKQKALEYYGKVKELVRCHPTPDDRKYGLEFTKARLETNLGYFYEEEKRLSQKALTLRQLAYASLVTYKKDSLPFFNSSVYKWVNFWTRAKEETAGDKECEKVCSIMIDIFDVYNTSKHIQALSKASQFFDTADFHDDFVNFIMYVSLSKGKDSFISDYTLNDINCTEATMNYLFKSAVLGNIEAVFLFVKEAANPKNSRNQIMDWIGLKTEEEFLAYMVPFSGAIVKYTPERLDEIQATNKTTY